MYSMTILFQVCLSLFQVRFKSISSLFQVCFKSTSGLSFKSFLAINPLCSYEKIKPEKSECGPPDVKIKASEFEVQFEIKEWINKTLNCLLQDLDLEEKNL